MYTLVVLEDRLIYDLLSVNIWFVHLSYSPMVWDLCALSLVF